MSNAFHMVKLILAGGFVVGGTVCLFLQMMPLATGLFIGSLAWSMLPEA